MTMKLIPVRVSEKDYRTLRKKMQEAGDIHLSTYCRRVLTDHLKEEASEAKNNRSR